MKLRHRFPVWRNMYALHLMIGLLHAEGRLDSAGRVRWRLVEGWSHEDCRAQMHDMRRARDTRDVAGLKRRSV